MSRICTCGMPAMPGLSWQAWHRFHEQQHLATYPDLDIRSRQTLPSHSDHHPTTGGTPMSDTNIIDKVLEDTAVYTMAERHDHAAEWTDLHPAVEREAIRSLVEHLAAAGMDGSDPDVFNGFMEKVAAEWDEHYANRR